MNTNNQLHHDFERYVAQDFSFDMKSAMPDLTNLIRNSALVQEGTDWVLESIEKLMYLSYCIFTAETTRERMQHIGAYLLYHSKGSMFKKAYKFLEYQMSDINKAPQPESPETPKSFSLSELIQDMDSNQASGYSPQSLTMRELLDNWERANESPLATKLRSVASYCMAFSLLEQCGFNTEFSEIIYAEFRVRKETKKVTSFIFSILDVAEFVIGRAQICWQTQSFAPMFHSSSTYMDWFAKVDEVKLMSKMRSCPEISGFKDSDYYLLLEVCIEKGDAMLPFVKTIAEKKVMQTIVGELKILRHDTMIEATVSKTRETPLAVLVSGNSSIGKSTLTELLGKRYAQVRGIVYSQECRYDRSPFDQYMSGFKSSKWFIVMDDVACLEPNKCSNGDLSLVDVIQLINCAPYTSNQAELDKKGKIPVLAKLVVANSNVLNLNVFHYFSHPSAVQRRFNFVLVPSVKLEFRKKNEDGSLIDALDGLKAKIWQDAHPCINGSEQIPDFWDFEIIEWLPAPIGKAKMLAIEYRPFKRKIGMEEFISYYDKRIVEHIASQMAMTNNIAGLRTSRACGVCSKPYQFCLERETHSALDDIPCMACHKVECIYKNQCTECILCNRIEMFCHCVSRTGYVSQSSSTCGNCTKGDCLWSEYQDAVQGKCKDCHHCISSEDILEGSCTWCLVSKMYFPQAGMSDYAHASFLMFLALVLQALLVRSQGIQSLGYQALQRRYEHLQVASNASIGVMTTIDAAERLANNAYSNMLRNRALVSNLGHRTGEFLKKRPVMIILGSVLVAIVAIKTMLKTAKKLEKLVPQSEAKPIKISKDEQVDPWKRDNYILSPLDVGRSVSNFRQLTKTQFDEMVSRNIYHLDIHIPDGLKRTKALAFADRYCLVNKHALGDLTDFTMDIIRQERCIGVSENLMNVQVTSSQITPLTGDLAVLFIPQAQPRKNIVDLFPESTYNARTHGYYLSRETDGSLSELEVKNLNLYAVKNAAINEGRPFFGFEGTVPTPTRMGFCGSPLIGESSLGRLILGLHSLGNFASSSIACRVTCQELREFLKDKNPIDTGDVVNFVSGTTYAVQNLHNKDTFNYCEDGCASIYGNLSGHRSSPKSLVGPTYGADYLVANENFQITHDKPDFSSYKPLRLGALAMIQQGFLLRYDVLHQARRDYFNCVSDRLQPCELDLLQKIEMTTVINGAPGVRGIDRIDMNTSAGMPRNKSKKNFFDFTVDDTGFRTYFPKSELQLEIDSALERYKRGERCNFIFMGALKDEPREFEKILLGKTRVFTGQAVAHLIIGRMYYLSFIRLMQRNRLMFECAVGTNAHSEDWDAIAHFLIDFSKFLFDGDYKNYDKSMMSMVIMEIFDGIIDFHRKWCKDMDEEDFRVMRGVGYDIAYAYVNYFGTLASFLRNNPSGHLLTVIVNSICGSLYLRIGFFEATGYPIFRYSEFVRAVTYGDDVVVAVHPSIVDKFNFETYRDGLAKYEIIFTPANKTGESYQFKSLDDVDFLKRRFVLCPVLDRYISPLSESSIQKSLVTCVRSKTITLEEQFVQTFASAHREMWQHGREKFDNFNALRLRVFDHLDLSMYVNPSYFPSFDSLTNYYKGGGDDKLWLGLPAKDFESYEAQGSRTSSRKSKTNSSLFDSYCSELTSVEFGENGSKFDIHQSVPQSLFLEKARLMATYANLPCQMVLEQVQHIQTAETNKTTQEFKNMGISDHNSDLKIEISEMTQSSVIETLDTNTNMKLSKDPLTDSIANFLIRPVEIVNLSVSSADSGAAYRYDPFALWRNIPSIGKKLSNYAFLRGKMCVRITLDTSPFNYGLLLSTLLGTQPGPNTFQVQYQMTQRDHIYLHIGADSEVILKKDLLFAGDWAEIKTQTTELLMDFIAPLRSANGISTVSSCRIFAWMENIELGGPTYITQSETVSTITNFNKIKNAPTLSWNSGSLLTSDSPVLESNIVKLCSTHPLIEAGSWTFSDAAGALISSYGVSPGLSYIDGETAYLTPLSLLSRYFLKWRGGLTFRFRFAASQYHAGSVRISWEPIASELNGGRINEVKTLVHNLREGNVVDFQVPYTQVQNMLKTDVGYDLMTSHVGLAAGYPDRENGRLTLKVFSQLSGPTSTGSVPFFVSVIPDEDFVFVLPNSGVFNATQHFYVPQTEVTSKQYTQECVTELTEVFTRPQYNCERGGGTLSESWTTFPRTWMTYGWTSDSGYVIKRTTTAPGPPVAVTEYFEDHQANLNSNPLCGHFKFASIGWRGSLIHTLLGDDAKQNLVLTNSRVDYPLATSVADHLFVISKTPVTGNPSNKWEAKFYSSVAQNIESKSSFCGAQISGMGVSSVLQAHVPYLEGKRYESVYQTVSDEPDQLVARIGTQTVRQYISAGPDFEFIQFLGLYPFRRIYLIADSSTVVRTLVPVVSV